MLYFGMGVNKTLSIVDGVIGLSPCDETVSILCAGQALKAIENTRKSLRFRTDPRSLEILSVQEKQRRKIASRLDKIGAGGIIYLEPGSFETYLVKNDDTLYKIASRGHFDKQVLECINKHIFTSGTSSLIFAYEILILSSDPKCLIGKTRQELNSQKKIDKTIVHKLESSNSNHAIDYSDGSPSYPLQPITKFSEIAEGYTISQRIAYLNSASTKLVTFDSDDLGVIDVINTSPKEQSFKLLKSLYSSGSLAVFLENIDGEYLPQFHAAFANLWKKSMDPLQLVDKIFSDQKSIYQFDSGRDNEVVNDLVADLKSIAEKKVLLYSDGPSNFLNFSRKDEVKVRSIVTVESVRDFRIKAHIRFVDLSAAEHLLHKYGVGPRTVSEILSPEIPKNSILHKFKHRWSSEITYNLNIWEPIGILCKTDIPMLGASNGVYFVVPAIFLLSLHMQRKHWLHSDWILGTSIISTVSALGFTPKIAALAEALFVILFETVNANKSTLQETASGRYILRIINALNFLLAFYNIAQLSGQIFIMFRKIYNVQKVDRSIARAFSKFENSLDDFDEELAHICNTIKERKPMSKTEFTKLYSGRCKGLSHNIEGDTVVVFSKEQELESAWKVYNDAASTRKELVMGSVGTQADPGDTRVGEALGMERIETIKIDDPTNPNKKADIWTVVVNDAWIQGAIDGQKSIYFGSEISTPLRFSNLTEVELKDLDPKNEINIWTLLRSHTTDAATGKVSFSPWKYYDANGNNHSVPYSEQRLRVTARELRQLTESHYALQGSIMLPLTELDLMAETLADNKYYKY